MREFLRPAPDFEVIVCPPEQSFRWSTHDYPWYRAKWNYHPEFELHLIAATSGTMMVGDYIGDFDPGNLVLTGPNVPHNWVSNIPPGEVVRNRDILVQFTAAWADKVAGLCPEMATIRPLFEDAVWGVEFLGQTAREGQRMLTEIGALQGPERVLQFFRLMERLAREPAECRRLSRQAPRIQAVLPEDIDRAMRFLNENYSGDIDLASVAVRAGLTPQTFSRLFKRQTGHSFSSYLVLTRVYAACTALTQTHRPITEICFATGFNTIANFNRQFFKVCGRTPSEYRNAAHRIGQEGASPDRVIPLRPRRNRPASEEIGGGKV